jgi:hypothetical protein
MLILLSKIYLLMKKKQDAALYMAEEQLIFLIKNGEGRKMWLKEIGIY